MADGKTTCDQLTADEQLLIDTFGSRRDFKVAPLKGICSRCKSLYDTTPKGNHLFDRLLFVRREMEGSEFDQLVLEIKEEFERESSAAELASG